MTKPNRTPLTVEVVGPFGCWIPNRIPQNTGYVRIWNKDRGAGDYLHRVVYESVIGPIPSGHDLHHAVCENRGCCNPWHVRPLTKPMHGLTTPRIVRFLTATHCQKGHEYTPENTRITKEGWRNCRRCYLEHARRYREQKRLRVQ